MRFVKKLVPNVYLALLLVFIYLPIAVLIIYSFNALPKSFIWGGFTLKNYQSLFKGSDGTGILESLIETLKVYVPNVMPDLVTGISFMLLFSFLGVQKSEFTLIMSHIALCVPFAILSISPKIKQLDKSLTEAAMDLGATRFQTLRLVIIPEIMPGILSSALLTFTLSIDDYLISNFNVDSSIQTLPMMIYSMAKLGVNPKMNALTTLMFGAVLILMVLSNLSSFKKNSKNAKKA